MLRRMFALILTLALLLPCLALGEEEYEPLYTLTEAYGFKLGAPMSYWNLNDRSYTAFVLKHFNSMTCTNEMKAYSLLDERASKNAADGMPVMNYTQADAMVKWAQAHGLGVRGHTLVWDAYMCDWFFHEDYDSAKPYADRETVMARTRYYIHEVVRHFEEKFPGVVYCWDVVNEAVGDSAGEYASGDPRHLRTLRSGAPNLFQKYLGDDYVELAFLWTREIVTELGCDTKLYYNDYNAYFPEKAEAILNLARSINSYAQNDDGEFMWLIDGIGMQGYIGGYGVQEGCLIPEHIDWFRQAIEGYAAEGLEVQVTEMAVRNFDPEQADAHAAFYADLFRMFMDLYDGEKNPLVAVSIWGFRDSGAPKGNYDYNLVSPYGGLVDLQLKIKDSFRQVYAALKGA